MGDRRIGPALRALRRHRRLRQVDVASAARVSQGTVSAVERGKWRTVSIRAIERVFEAVGAEFECSVRGRGAEVERLLDERHASVVIALSRYLEDRGWRVFAEVSFNRFGDRGSIDLMAFHAATRTLLIVEVKTEIASAEELLRRLDVKVRLGPQLGADRFGERPARTVRLLAVVSSTSNRERVALLGPLLGSALPTRGDDLRRWIAHPGSDVRAGLLFVRYIGSAVVTASPRRVRLRRDGGSTRA